MNVTLAPELEKLVQRKIADGGYNSPTEVIEEGLRLLAAQEQISELGLDRLREDIAVGLKQLDAGEGLRGEQIFLDLQVRSQARRSAGE